MPLLTKNRDLYKISQKLRLSQFDVYNKIKAVGILHLVVAFYFIGEVT